MAYYNSNQTGTNESSLGMNKKEDEVAGAPANEGAAPQVTNNAANAAAPSGPTAAPLNGNPIPQNTAPKANSSGMGGGFQSYKKANQGAASNRLNTAAQNNVTAQGNAAQTSINQATDQFGKKVEAGTLANRYQAVSDVANTVNSARTLSAAPAAPLAATATPAAPASPAPAPAAPVIAGQDRFKEVINAKYQGPESLRQSGLYQGASDKVGTAQTTLNQTKTAAGREDMLKDMYSKRGEYTRGLNKLDSSILNSSQSGVQGLQNAAQAQGNISQKLDKAQLASGNLAQNRTQEIKGIRDDARNTFTTGKKAEEAATDERLSTVVKDWDKLPEYFRNIIRNKEKDNAATNDEAVSRFKTENNYDQVGQQQSQAQAAVQAAQKAENQAQINFNMGIGGTTEQDLNNAKAAVANAHSKYSALSSQKANLDSQYNDLSNNYNKNAVNLSDAESKMLGIENGEGLYNLGADAIKTAAYDKEKLISRDEQARQAALSQLAGLDNSNMLDTNLKYGNAGKAGLQSASDAIDITGTRAGLNEGEENFRDYAEGATLTGTGSKKNKSSGKRYYADQSANLKDVLSNAGYDFDSDLSKRGPNNSQISASSVGSTTFDEDANGLLSPYQNQNSASQGAQAAVDYATLGAAPIMRQLGINIPGITDVGSLFGGQASSKQSKNEAKGMAQADLEAKMKNAISTSGFQNRFAVTDNQATKSRTTALEQLLANLDKTNKR